MAEPLFIVAGNLRLAASTAMDLGLPHSPNSPYWRYLDDSYALRGRGSVRVCFGYGWFDHPRAEQIEMALKMIDRKRPGAVEHVEIPEDRP